MMRLLLPVALAMAASACAGIDEPAAVDVVTRFHGALNVGDWAAIDAMLTQSTRNLRPGGGTARAFRAIPQRHRRYLDGKLVSIEGKDGRITIMWAARYEKGPVSELFVLVKESGALKIDSYADRPAS